MTTRRMLLRSRVISDFVGRAVRSLDLIMDNHIDQARAPQLEAKDIERQAAYILFITYFGEEAVHLMDSSTFKLPKKLAESDAISIRNFIRERGYAPNGND